MSKKPKRPRTSRRIRPGRTARIRAVVDRVGGQRELARILFQNPAKSTLVNEWVAGRKGPSLDNYVLLAKKTGVSLDWLLELVPEEDVALSHRGPWRAVLEEVYDGISGDDELHALSMHASSIVGFEAELQCRHEADAAVRRMLQRSEVLRAAKAKWREVFQGNRTIAAYDQIDHLRRDKANLRVQLKAARATQARPPGPA